MSDDSMVSFVQMLSVTGAWVVIVSSVSTMYRLALERYGHSEWWNDHGRFLMENRLRRRL